MPTNLWTYWEGPMPAWVESCVRSMRRECTLGGDTLTIVTPATAEDLCGGLPRGFFDLEHPAHRADVVRAAVLARFGGWYWDCDTLAVRPPSHASDAVAGADFCYFVWTNPPFRVLNGYAYAPVGSTTAKGWRDAVYARVESTPPSAGMPWTALGEQALTPIVTDAAARLVPVRRLPLDTVLPVDVDATPKRLMSRGPVGEIVRPHTICVGLNHSFLKANFGVVMRMRPTGTHRMVHKLLVQYGG